MGFNFRKRIKLGKYVNLNLSKSGPSLSVGRKGMRQSINLKGVGRTTLSIPGTGMYYTKTMSAKPLLKKLGRKDIFDRQGKNLPSQEEVQEFDNDLMFLMNLHQEADYEENIDWDNWANQQPPFVKGTSGPFEQDALKQIKQSSGGFFQRLFHGGNKTQESQLLQAEAVEKDLQLYKTFENMQMLAGIIKTGGKEEFLQGLENLKLSILLEEYVDTMDFSYTDEDSLKVDMTVLVEDFIPKDYKTLTSTGKLSVKTYTKTDYYQIVSQFVSGLTIKTARNLFHLLPIEDVFINVLEKKEDELSKRLETNLILSVYIKRDQLEGIKDFEVDPLNLITTFPHEVKFVPTRGFKPISPLDEMFQE